MPEVKYFQEVQKLKHLSSDELSSIKPIVEMYKFRANNYYLNLIDWNDPDDPIRKIIIPSPDEFDSSGNLDVSNESSYYTLKGLQHKYADTALLILTRVCGSICRFCFRKRIFMSDNDELYNDIEAGIDYIRTHHSIINVILSGGEPLLLSTKKLEKIIRSFDSIPHVRTIRIGTKIPVFNPFRIIEDEKLQAVFKQFSRSDRRIYVITHINHPNELTEYSRKAIVILQNSGAVLYNQTPILKGINDSPEILSELMVELSSSGITPYYFFINRPTAGNIKFCLPITTCYNIFTAAHNKLSGLSKIARLVMSHISGKIEVVGLDARHIYMRYHRAVNPENNSKVVTFKRNDSLNWFDEF